VVRLTVRYFRRLDSHFDMMAARRQIAAHPELWGEHLERTGPGSPHAQSQDIWLRFRDSSELHEPKDYGAPHWPVWYHAWTVLTQLHPIVFGIAHEMRATAIGGILLTRIPPQAAILPHVDTGWHPGHFLQKAYAILAANAACVNICLDEEVVMREGECWQFVNHVEHSVRNDGATDRIALIVTMRTV
jgi:hypothetical protein